MADLKISVIIPVLTISSAFICAFETNRTERSWKGGTNAHAWHYGLQRNLNTAYPGSWYLDYGAIPFAVTIPPRTYVPPVEWPDYTGNPAYLPAYPSADRPPSTAAPAPASEPSSGNPPIYLPPQAPATTTEFTLPEVIDAKKPTMVTIANMVTRESKRTFDNSNRNGWPAAAADVYRAGHSNEPAKIIEMKCDNGGEGRFRAILQWPEFGRPSGVPVLEDGRDGQRASGECAVVEDGARMELDVPSSRYPVCGVTDCSDDGGVNFLCVRLRFPTMAGLRLADDFVLTLRCRVQEPIVIHTKRVEVPVSGGVAGRSGGAVATGGASNEVRCRLDVLRRGSGDQFSSFLLPGAAVPLGEELLVRVTVAEGDGWVSSRLGEVAVQETGVGVRGARAGVTLVTADGCAAPGASAVCPQHPRRESALAHALIIRAPMFEGSSSGSSVQLSVRVLACRRAYDCASSCARRARSAPYTHNGANTTVLISTGDGAYKTSEEDHISYKQHSESNNDDEISTEINGNLAHRDADIIADDLKYKKSKRSELAEKYNSLNSNESKDTVKIRKRREKEAKVAQEDDKMVADSVASVAFAVVRHTTDSNRADSHIKSIGINDKPVAMIIVLGGLVSVLMLAVLLAHIYRKRAQKNEVL